MIPERIRRDVLVKISQEYILGEDGIYREIIQEITEANFSPLYGKDSGNIFCGENIKEGNINIQIGESEDSISIVWTTEDVINYVLDSYDEELSETEAMEILRMVDRNHDSEYGVNWDTIDAAYNEWKHPIGMEE